jgi:hypothetical protein
LYRYTAVEAFESEAALKSEASVREASAFDAAQAAAAAANASKPKTANGDASMPTVGSCTTRMHSDPQLAAGPIA